MTNLLAESLNYAKEHNLEMIQVIDGADVKDHAFEKHDYLGKGCKLINS